MPRSGRGRGSGAHRPVCAVLAALLVAAVGSGCVSGSGGQPGDTEHRDRPLAGNPGSNPELNPAATPGTNPAAGHPGGPGQHMRPGPGARRGP